MLFLPKFQLELKNLQSALCCTVVKLVVKHTNPSPGMPSKNKPKFIILAEMTCVYFCFKVQPNIGDTSLTRPVFVMSCCYNHGKIKKKAIRGHLSPQNPYRSFRILDKETLG